MFLTMNKIHKKILTIFLLTHALSDASIASDAEKQVAYDRPVVLTLESWRSEDAKIWNNEILPVFEALHPGIDVVFSPTKPTEYNAALNARLDGNTAGDLISCRPFDNSLELFHRGHLLDITQIDGMKHFSDVAKSAWSTDDGDATFCIPVASVLHGFFYNKNIFSKLDIDKPSTEAEFFDVLKKLDKASGLTPLAIGTKDQWEAATVGLNLVGPQYWEGENGRLGLINGSKAFTDPQFVEAFSVLERWRPYLSRGYQAQSYSDSQSLFLLERAAIYPGGSWEISGFQSEAEFPIGVFRAPVKSEGESCYISDHTDIGIAINSRTAHRNEAMLFAEWLTTQSFANLLTNKLPGFFALSDHPVTVDNPLAQEFLGLRTDCMSTIRLASQILSRGQPSLGNALWTLSAEVLNGTKSPLEAALDSQNIIEGQRK